MLENRLEISNHEHRLDAIVEKILGTNTHKQILSTYNLSDSQLTYIMGVLAGSRDAVFNGDSHQIWDLYMDLAESREKALTHAYMNKIKSGNLHLRDAVVFAGKLDTQSGHGYVKSSNLPFETEKEAKNYLEQNKRNVLVVDVKGTLEKVFRKIIPQEAKENKQKFKNYPNGEQRKLAIKASPTFQRLHDMETDYLIEQYEEILDTDKPEKIRFAHGTFISPNNTSELIFYSLTRDIYENVNSKIGTLNHCLQKDLDDPIPGQELYRWSAMKDILRETIIDYIVEIFSKQEDTPLYRRIFETTFSSLVNPQYPWISTKEDVFRMFDETYMDRTLDQSLLDENEPVYLKICHNSIKKVNNKYNE